MNITTHVFQILVVDDPAKEKYQTIVTMIGTVELIASVLIDEQKTSVDIKDLIIELNRLQSSIENQTKA